MERPLGTTWSKTKIQVAAKGVKQSAVEQKGKKSALRENAGPARVSQGAGAYSAPKPSAPPPPRVRSVDAETRGVGALAASATPCCTFGAQRVSAGEGRGVPAGWGPSAAKDP